MARKSEEYVIGVLFPTETTTEISFVTEILPNKVAKWENGKPAKTFSKGYAKDVAIGLCANGYIVMPILKEDYLELKNPDGKPESKFDNPMYNKGYDDGYGDALNELGEEMEARTFYCNCCGTEWKSKVDKNVVCPNCGCEYNPDENDFIECY